MWPVNTLPDATLITVDIYVINLGSLKDKLPYFMEFLDGGMEESNKKLVELNTAPVISETKNLDLPDQIYLESEWANKKKEKT